LSIRASIVELVVQGWFDHRCLPVRRSVLPTARYAKRSSGSALVATSTGGPVHSGA
jgi:hypothetical protein